MVRSKNPNLFYLQKSSQMSWIIQRWFWRNNGLWDMWFRMNKKQEEQLNLAIAETWIAVLKANPELIKTLTRDKKWDVKSVKRFANIHEINHGDITNYVQTVLTNQ